MHTYLQLYMPPCPRTQPPAVSLAALTQCWPCTYACSGEAIAYHLHPAQGPCLLAQADSPVAQRGMFTTKNLMVTPYAEGQLYPAGTYVMQSSRDSGLGQWTQQVRCLRLVAAAAAASGAEKKKKTQPARHMLN